MRYRKLGRNGPTVSAISMGRGSQGIKLDDAPGVEAFNATIRRAIELGINFFDSSDAYWGTRHEVLLGRAIKGFRDQVLISSKFGNIDLPDGRKGTNGRPEYVHQCCIASLKRMDVDVIDVYYLHRVDPNVPIEETVGAMAGLIEQGKVRYIGLCEAGPATLRRAQAAHPIAALQTEYSLWFREVERDVIPTCRELGIGYVAYAPLGRGLLTGRIRTVDDLAPNDRRRVHPRFAPENLARNVKLVEELERMAQGQGATAAQLALAWILAQGDDIVPIPGTNHVKNLELNAAAADIRLSAEKLARLNEIFAIGAGAGKRYHDRVLKGVGI
ncbi:MAG: aldo/keto reductase [Betaproteobacteria bacterium RIFCSPLOWO2_02_FULL_67_26]|nr:MAG: aldo/keto reductase [Betaproteobacteria bacterium RIFCSPLOWO2_02_FULL_67_26]